MRACSVCWRFTVFRFRNSSLIELEVVLDRRLVQDVGIGAIIHETDAGQAVWTDFAARERRVGVAADVVDGRHVRDAESELPLPLGILRPRRKCRQHDPCRPERQDLDDWS